MKNELGEYACSLISMIDVWLDLPLVERRSRIEKFQEIVEGLAVDSPYTPPITNHYGHNTYGREAFAQKGAVIVGAIYKEPQINILISGKVFVATEQKIGIMEGPLVFTSDPNTKKVGYVIEDMRWITVMSRDSLCGKPDEILAKHVTEEYGGD